MIANNRVAIRKIVPPIEALTPQTFAPFGRVVTDWTAVALQLKVGETARNQMRARQTTVIEWLSAHDDGEQALIPVEPIPTVFVVCPPSPMPSVEKARAFVSNGKVGVCFSQGVWHAFPIPIAAEHALYNNAQGSQWHQHTREVHLPTALGCVLVVGLEGLSQLLESQR